jgi:hypothetical protein
MMDAHKRFFEKYREKQQQRGGGPPTPRLGRPQE